MRTGAGRRRIFQVRLRPRGVAGVLVLALPLGLLHVEVAGRNAGTAIAEFLIPPAHARKGSARAARTLGSHLRREPGAPIFPAFPSTVPVSPFQPSAGRLPEIRAVPNWRPSPSAGVRTAPGFSAHAPGFAVPPGPVRQASRAGEAERHGQDGLHRLARLPAMEGIARGGWRTVVEPAQVQAGMGRLTLPEPVPHQPTPRAPVEASRQPGAKPHAAFHRLLEKLSGRPVRSTPKTSATPPGAKAHEGRPAGPAKPAAGRLGGRPFLGEMLPPAGTFRSNEVLAINLSAEGLNKARDGHYELVERIDLPEFGLTISRLRLPETLNAINGRDRLFDLLPQEGFTLNRVYAPYRPGAGRSSDAAAVAAQSGRGCPSERCFGAGLIDWQPRLAACAHNVTVGIVDTGFDRGHPAFSRVRYRYKEFLPEGGARASLQHGTGVLSLLAGSADSGTPGLIPDASYVIANAFFADDNGQPMSDTAQMLRALHWLRQNGVEVVNLSFAGPDDELLHHAVRELTKAGVVVVAAAGNEGPAAPPSYPAAYQEVIAVTAVDRNLAAYRYANRGAHIDLAAPGVDVWTAIPGRLEGPQTGTSFAVPYVTAVVAVTLPDTGPAPGDDALAAKRRALARLHGSVKTLSSSGRDPTFGAGLVQAPASCAQAVAVAAHEPPAAPSWAGTVQRAVDAHANEPLIVGSWASTVQVVSSGGVAR